jgi:serine/threonine protein kinase
MQAPVQDTTTQQPLREVNTQNQLNQQPGAQRRSSKLAEWLKAKVSKANPKDNVPEESIAMCGYLEVKVMAKKRSSWKKRFVILRTDTASLVCFKKKEELRRQEDLTLTPSMTVNAHSSEEDPFLIELRVRGTCVMALKTYSARYQEEWVGAIHSLIEQKRDSEQPPASHRDRDEDLDESSELSPSSGEDLSSSNDRFTPTPQEPIPELSTFMLQGTRFQIDAKFDPIKVIGTGAYGVVISAKDKKAGRNVAIKKITNLFEDLEDAKRILREIRLLQHLKHSNVISIVDVLPSPYPKLRGLGSTGSSNNSGGSPNNSYQLDDIYIVLELMETDLSKVIYSKVPLTPEHVRFFLYQILRGCKHMHSKGVLHRDIKPANLLVNAQCDLKVCDFGLARIVEGESRTQPDGLATLTEYVVTRWYRAPEIMLCCDEYGPAIDVWAVGCVFGEMLLRKALFAGKDYLQQLRMIADGLPMPPMQQIEGFVKNDQALAFLRKLPTEQKRLVVDRLQRAQDSGRGIEATPEAVDLLLRMLAFDPRERISIDEAMAHPYLAELHSQRWPEEEDTSHEKEEQRGHEPAAQESSASGRKNEEVSDVVEAFEGSMSSDTAHSSRSSRSPRSPREPQSERPQQRGRVVRKSQKANSVQPYSTSADDGGGGGGGRVPLKKPTLLDHHDFHFEKLGPLARMELQEIFMREIARFHPELEDQQ